MLEINSKKNIDISNGGKRILPPSKTFNKINLCDTSIGESDRSTTDNTMILSSPFNKRMPPIIPKKSSTNIKIKEKK